MLAGELAQFGARVGLEDEDMGVGGPGLDVQLQRIEIIGQGAGRQADHVGRGKVQASLADEAGGLEDLLPAHATLEQVVADAVVAGLDAHADRMAAGLLEQPHLLLGHEVGPRVAEEGQADVARVLFGELGQPVV